MRDAHADNVYPHVALLRRACKEHGLLPPVLQNALTGNADVALVRMRKELRVTRKISFQDILVNVPYASLLSAHSPSRVSWLIFKIRLILVQIEELPPK